MTATALSGALLPLVRGLVSAVPSAIPRRQRRLAGRRARVDGIDFSMPVNSEQTPALMAAFPVDGDAAARLLPGDELHPVRLPGGRGLLVVTVVNYEVTDIGRYVEYSLAIACTFGARPAPPLLPGLLRGRYGTGQFVVDLPVSSEISVKGGKGIWGMPKHQANLDFVITPTTVSSQYDVDGQLGARIEIDRPPPTALPLDVGAAELLRLSRHGDAVVHLLPGSCRRRSRPRARARLDLGDAPPVAPLRDLGMDPDPVFTAFLPSTRGVLDDHFECWFLTSDDPQSVRSEGLESVVDLGLSEDWLDPPKVRVGGAG